MTWNVIIVGGGSAGCVLAARLSEDPRRSVLLLEAGPDYADLASTPPEIAAGNQGGGRSHDWGYATEPAGRVGAFALPRAKLVGGCSATNAAMRGIAGDYDEWARRGNPGWSFGEVLPLFCRLEATPTSRRRPNLTIRPDVLVDRVALDRARAVGVHWRNRARRCTPGVSF